MQKILINFSRQFSLNVKDAPVFVNIRASNNGFVFDGATRMLSFRFNWFRLLDFIATEDENPDSHKYVVAKGIIAAMAFFTKRGYACPDEIQKSPILFELKDILIDSIALNSISSSLASSSSLMDSTSARKGLRIQYLFLRFSVTKQ